MFRKEKLIKSGKIYVALQGKESFTSYQSLTMDALVISASVCPIAFLMFFRH